MNKLQKQQDQTLKTYKTEQSKLLKQRENIIEAIKNGVAVELIKDDLESISDRLKKLEYLLKNKEETQPLLHPIMAERYRDVIEDLSIDLYGDLAGILKIASKKNAMKNMSLEKQLRQLDVNDYNQPEPSIELVSGA